jgi:hypothetical protein
MSDNKFQGRKFELYARFGQPTDSSDDETWDAMKHGIKYNLPMAVYSSQESMENSPLGDMPEHLKDSPVYQVRITVECIKSTDAPAHENLND